MMMLHDTIYSSAFNPSAHPFIPSGTYSQSQSPSSISSPTSNNNGGGDSISPSASPHQSIQSRFINSYTNNNNNNTSPSQQHQQLSQQSQQLSPSIASTHQVHSPSISAQSLSARSSPHSSPPSLSRLVIQQSQQQLQQQQYQHHQQQQQPQQHHQYYTPQQSYRSAAYYNNNQPSSGNLTPPVSATFGDRHRDWNHPSQPPSSNQQPSGGIDGFDGDDDATDDDDHKYIDQDDVDDEAQQQQQQQQQPMGQHNSNSGYYHPHPQQQQQQQYQQNNNNNNNSWSASSSSAATSSSSRPSSRQSTYSHQGNSNSNNNHNQRHSPQQQYNNNNNNNNNNGGGVSNDPQNEQSPLFLPALPTFPLTPPPGMAQVNLGPNPLINLTIDHVRGHILRLVKTHAGSRYIQQKIEMMDPLFISLFNYEMKDHIAELMVDHFAHFAMEKLICAVNDEQQLYLLHRLAPAITVVSCQKHGSFSIQALVDILHTPAQIYILVEAMKPDILRMITHASGHFVVLRMLQRYPYITTRFIDEAICNNVTIVSTDHHGLRVLKALLCVRRSTELTRLFKQIARMTMKLVENCYGNYALQAVLDVAPPGVRTNIKVKMEGKYMRLSKQKFSSNVVEKCLKQSSTHWRSIIIRELITQPAVAELLRDRYGNYVLQTGLNVANTQQVMEMQRAITPYLPSLRENVRAKWKKMLKKAQLCNTNDHPNNNNGDDDDHVDPYDENGSNGGNNSGNNNEPISPLSAADDDNDSPPYTPNTNSGMNSHISNNNELPSGLGLNSQNHSPNHLTNPHNTFNYQQPSSLSSSSHIHSQYSAQQQMLHNAALYNNYNVTNNSSNANSNNMNPQTNNSLLSAMNNLSLYNTTNTVSSSSAVATNTCTPFQHLPNPPSMVEGINQSSSSSSSPPLAQSPVQCPPRCLACGR